MNKPEQDKRNQQSCKHCSRIVGCDYRGRKHKCNCYPACDRDDCRYYTLGNREDIREKCSECLENCQREHPEGFNHYESE